TTVLFATAGLLVAGLARPLHAESGVSAPPMAMIALTARAAAALAPATAAEALPTATRFVVGLDRPVAFQVSALSEPNRVVVELPDVKLRLPMLPEGKAAGLVKSFRGGLSAPGRMRVVIDVTEPVVVESAKIVA